MKKIIGLLSLMVLGWAGAQAWAEGGAVDGAALFSSNCARCHGDDGGKSPGGITPLKQQTAAVIIEKLNGYKAGTYGGERKSTMEGMVQGVTEEQIVAVAGYIGQK